MRLLLLAAVLLAGCHAPPRRTIVQVRAALYAQDPGQIHMLALELEHEQLQPPLGDAPPERVRLAARFDEAAMVVRRGDEVWRTDLPHEELRHCLNSLYLAELSEWPARVLAPDRLVEARRARIALQVEGTHGALSVAGHFQRHASGSQLDDYFIETIRKCLDRLERRARSECERWTKRVRRSERVVHGALRRLRRKSPDEARRVEVALAAIVRDLPTRSVPALRERFDRLSALRTGLSR